MYHILEHVSEKWRGIGRELGIPGKMLQALQDANLPPEQCCSKVIEEWLMYSGDEPSWYSLTEALRRLDMKQEVDKIMMKWSKPLILLLWNLSLTCVCILTGSYVQFERELKDENKRNYAVTDSFWSLFNDVVESHMIVAYIITTTILQQLQGSKDKSMPTYGELFEIFNQLITDPIIINSREKGIPLLRYIVTDFHLSSFYILHEGTSTQNEHISDGEVEVWNNEEEDRERMEVEKQKQLLDIALEEGHIKTGLDVLLFTGAAGSGKSHYKHLCLGLPPPEVRDSTGLSEHPVRTMSLVRGAVEQMPQNRETTDCSSIHWHEVPAKRFIELIVEAILEGKYEKISDSAVMATLAKRAIEGLPVLDMEHGPETMGYMNSSQKESAVHDRSDIPEQVQVALENKAFTQSEKPSSACVHYESNFYQELLRKLKSSPTSQTKRGKLLDVDWIYIVDSGGQPQFREMLPLLVKMATACVLTLKLNVPLGMLNKVECVERGKELCKPYLSVLTNEQIVKHCSQIVDSQTKDCKLFVVGTHQDLEHECQMETRASKNEKLLKLLQPQLGTNLEVYKTGNPVELIFPVNSKTPKERDYRVVEQFRRAVHNLARSKAKVDIPLYWFLLELLLHQLAANSGILSFEGCKEEAIRQLNISEEAFPTAVKFLAQKLGTIVYFPKVLPNVIFTPQALMSILSAIVKIRHLLNDNQPLPVECQGHSGEWLRFQRSGIMTMTILRTAQFSGFFSNIFTPNDFLIVTMRLLIVARISDDAFFFPSVLEELSPEGVHERVATSQHCLAPLVLLCSDSTVVGNTKENWLPVGSFTSLIAQLLNVNKWTLRTDEMQNPSCLYRNCIQFTLPDNQPGIVTLVDQFRHMEVYLEVNPETAKRISKIIVPTLYTGLKEVHKSLLHSVNTIEIAFLCPQHNGCHTASITRSDRGQWNWTCKQDRITTGKVTARQWTWLSIDILIRGNSNIFCVLTILCPYHLSYM